MRDHAASVCAGQPFRVSASVGVVLFGELDAESPEDVLGGADLALYEVKDAGRDGFAFYNREKHAKDRDRASISWGQEIRDALDEDRLILYAQPICDATTLARWSSTSCSCGSMTRDGDTVPPGVFLGIAERIDLVQAIDQRVVERAVAARRPSAAVRGASRQARGEPLRPVARRSRR